MTQTKLLTYCLLVVAALAAAQHAAGQGAPLFTVTMDEFGTGTTTLPTGGIVPTPTLVPAPPDPLLVPGFAPTPVVYSLPFLGGAVSPGDLILIEPSLPGTNQTQSDLLRFFQNLVYVYSDVSASDPADAPADVGVPPATTAIPVLILPETGPEAGINGLFGYTPVGPAMPGFVPGAPGGVTYNFISDTPEPSTLVLAALAAAGLAIIRRRR